MFPSGPSGLPFVTFGPCGTPEVLGLPSPQLTGEPGKRAYTYVGVGQETNIPNIKMFQ